MYDIINNMKLLVIVNAQNDYTIGSVGYPNAVDVLDKIKNAISDFDDCLFVLESHDKNYSNTLEAKYLETPHTIKGTTGFEIHDKLKEFTKNTIESDSFASLELGEYLKNNYYDEIYLCGFYFHIQVLEDAIIAKAFSKNSKIIVLRELSGTYDKKYALEAENILRSNHIEVR